MRLKKQILRQRRRQMHANWIAQAKEHWEEFQPTRYAELQQEGKLMQALTDAADRTQDEIETLMAQGFSYNEAWEATREQYLFPPEEDGASEEAPDSEGYKAMKEANRAMKRFWESEGY